MLISNQVVVRYFLRRNMLKKPIRNYRKDGMNNGKHRNHAMNHDDHAKKHGRHGVIMA